MNKKNLANAELLTSITDTQTTLEVKQGQGTNFPQAPFLITVTPLGVLSTIDNSEIMEVTDVNADVLTVVRGQRGSSQFAFSDNSVVVNGIYAEDTIPTGGTNGQVLKRDASGNAVWDMDTDTTYSEITEAEITAGTSSTARSISGRRAQAIVSKSQANLSPAIQLNANKTAVGINKVPEQGVLDVAGDIYSDGVKVSTYQPSNYSTSEQDTGIKWVDGKTIYRKVVSIPTVTAKSAAYSHGISNLHKVIHASGTGTRTSNGWTMTIPMTYTNWQIWIYDFAATNFRMNMDDNQWNAGLKDVFIILEYTKTS